MDCWELRGLKVPEKTPTLPHVPLHDTRYRVISYKTLNCRFNLDLSFCFQVPNWKVSPSSSVYLNCAQPSGGASLTRPALLKRCSDFDS